MNLILEPDKAGARVLCLGTFDGVHLAHKVLLKKSALFAHELGIKLRVCTFLRHPAEIVSPKTAPRQLTGQLEKLAQLASMEPDEIEMLPFTRETAKMEPEAFLEQLRQRFDLKAVCVGWNYTFGRNGRGTVTMLRADGQKYGYRVMELTPVKNDAGEIISSSEIRKKLEAGEIQEAEKMLGRPYFLVGTVCHEKKKSEAEGRMVVSIPVEPRKMLPGPGTYAGLLGLGETLPCVVTVPDAMASRKWRRVEIRLKDGSTVGNRKIERLTFQQKIIAQA